MKHGVLLLSLLLLASGAQAQGWDGGRRMMGNSGWDKRRMCVGCHDMGMSGGGHWNMGTAAGEVAPKLAGQHHDYLEKALLAYKTGERRHSLMNRIAGMLSRSEIAALADDYGSGR